jgi:hypothetical protein
MRRTAKTNDNSARSHFNSKDQCTAEGPSSGPGTLSPFPPTTSSFFDAYNRLNLGVGSAHDNVGNQTQQGGYVQTYDAEGHVTSSTINSATTMYGYDGDGPRSVLEANSVSRIHTLISEARIAHATEFGSKQCN